MCPHYPPNFSGQAYSLSVPLNNPGNNSTLIWDAENRLTSATVNGTTTTYRYDALSRRIAIWGAGLQPASSPPSTMFIYDGWNPIGKYAGTTLVESYLWGMDLSGSMQGAGGVGGLLAVTDSTGSYYPTYDGNGNVSEYLDSSSAVAAHYEYDPFGNTVVSTGPKVADFAHRFSTKPQDFETGLYYYGYRYYDPVTGRWPSRDPIGEDGGVNLYAFVENDGINKWDLLGLDKITVKNELIHTSDLWRIATKVADISVEINAECAFAEDGVCELKRNTFSVTGSHHLTPEGTDRNVKVTWWGMAWVAPDSRKEINVDIMVGAAYTPRGEDALKASVLSLASLSLPYTAIVNAGVAAGFASFESDDEVATWDYRLTITCPCNLDTEFECIRKPTVRLWKDSPSHSRRLSWTQSN
jgi:RHS repeat-associated protein